MPQACLIEFQSDLENHNTANIKIMETKKLRRFETHFDNKKYLIEEEFFYPPNEEILVWAYLYIYEDDLCTEDHLQDNVEMCMKYALDICQVPLESWQELHSTLTEENTYT